MVLQCLRTLRAVLDATPTSEFYIDLLDSHWTASFVPNASRHILHVASNSRFIGQGHGLFEPREQKIEQVRHSSRAGGNSSHQRPRWWRGEVLRPGWTRADMECLVRPQPTQHFLLSTPNLVASIYGRTVHDRYTMVHRYMILEYRVPRMTLCDTSG